MLLLRLTKRKRNSTSLSSHLSDFLQSVSQLDPVWIYAVIFFVSFIENIFPPAPSDTLVVFGGALSAMGHGSFAATLIAGVAGSTVGFMTMYSIGRWFGKRILETGRLKFIPLDSIHKAEAWFSKYGDFMIIANRFLSGTRAVISFFAGVSQLNFTKTTILSFLSSLAWYTVLVYAGYALGHNWQNVFDYMSTYSAIVTGIIIILAVAFLIRYILSHKKTTE